MNRDHGGRIGLLTLTFSALGIGVLISLVVGVVLGLIIDDMARGIGQGVLVGTGVTAVVIVLLVLARRR